VTVFSRITARLLRIVPSLKIDAFQTAIRRLFDLIAHQKVELRELDNQLPDIVVFYLGLRTQITPFVLLLLLKELSERFSPIILKAVIAATKVVGLSPEQEDFALAVCAHHSIQPEPPIAAPLVDGDDLDAATFWIAQKRELFVLHEFLDAVAARIHRQNWAQCFSLALERPVAYAALARLVRAADCRVIERIAGSAIAHTAANDERYLAFSVVLFGKVGLLVADALICFITKTEIENGIKFAVIRAGLRKFGNFHLRAYEGIAAFACSVLYPDGINFVVSLLLDGQLEACGMALLRLGVLEAVANSLGSSIRPLPRILHFLSVSLMVGKKYSEGPQFESVLIGLVFRALKLTGSQPERAAVLAPACKLLRTVSRGLLQEQWMVEGSQAGLIATLEPPAGKRHAEIELKIFAERRSRRSNLGGWQSLDVEDD
jgi:hypothetical protein